MIGQWENGCMSLSVFSMARVQFPAMAEHFQGFSPASHTLFNLFRASLAQSPLNYTTQPVDIKKEAYVQPWIDRTDRQTG